MTNRLQNKKKKTTDFILKDIFDPLKSGNTSDSSTPLIDDKEDILLETENLSEAPISRAKKEDTTPRFIFILGMVAAIVGFYWACYEIWLPNQAIQKTRELEATRYQLEVAKHDLLEHQKEEAQLLKLMDASKNQKAYLKETQSLIQSVRREGKPFVQVLSTFPKIQSDGMWLERLSMQKGIFTLKGYVLDPVFLNWFIEALKVSKHYDEVLPKSSKPVFLRSGKIITQFEISLVDHV